MSDPKTDERLNLLEARLARIEESLARISGERFAPPETRPPASAPPPLPADEPPADERFTPARITKTNRRDVTPQQTEAPPAPSAEAPPALPASKASEPRENPFASSSEAWLARLGILLLIAGLAFFLKLSFDRGWISPPVRLVLSSLAAIGLIIAGEFNRAMRPGLAHAMIGGGIAFAFGTVFAAYFLFGYLSAVPAFLLTVAIAAGCFGQSIRCNSAALATLGAIGGFAAPVLLASPMVPVWSIGVQTAVVFAACSALHALRGWRWFFAISLTLALLTMLIGSASLRPAGQAFWDFIGGNLADATSRFSGRVTTPATAGGWLQGSMIFMTIVACVATAWRQLRGLKNSLAEFTALAAPFALLLVTDSLWYFPSSKALGIFSISLAAFWGAAALAFHHWHPGTRLAGAYAATAAGLAALAPALFFETRTAIVFVVVVGLAFCVATEKKRSGLESAVLLLISLYVLFATVVIGARMLWAGYTEDWIGLFVSGIVGGCYFVAAANILRGRAAGVFARFIGYALLAFILLATTSWFDSPGAASAASIITLALAARFIEARPDARDSVVITHLLFACGALLLGLTILTADAPRTPFGNLDAVLLIYGVLGLGAGGWQSPAWKAYLPAAVLAAAGVIWHELHAFQSGEWVSILWALMAVGLVTAGVRLKSGYVMTVGFLFLGLTLARLFFIDLAALDPVGKAAVFTIVGALLLAAGVLLPRFLRKEP